MKLRMYLTALCPGPVLLAGMSGAAVAAAQAAADSDHARIEKITIPDPLDDARVVGLAEGRASRPRI